MPRARLIFAITLSLAGCTSNPRRPEALPLPPLPINMGSYSVSPPNEPGWLRAPSAPTKLVLGRYGSATDETFVIEGNLFDLQPFNTIDGFTTQANEINAARLPPHRFKTTKYEAVLENGRNTECVRAHIVSDDTAAVKRTTNTMGTMTLEIMTLTCVLPSNKKMAVNVAYSHRYMPKNADPEFATKAAAILGSVAFSSAQ
ncbi:hypothetical protein [Dechloromonas denitrificans]|uniref:hypothetical protein n=1 Tax=Dechloromonas denitrificans TaxID=281362 RepID=UPI001CF93CF7|nr:hypothetical protein [Dechloromonas denitrificans]UCV09388.1 hypothetical protein KI615_07695 [Dechloromonas denitrificans]